MIGLIKKKIEIWKYKRYLRKILPLHYDDFGDIKNISLNDGILDVKYTRVLKQHAQYVKISGIIDLSEKNNK